MPARRSSHPLCSPAFAGLRIAVGVLFLIFAEYKVFGTAFTLGGGMESWLQRFLRDGAYPWMVPALRDWVLPRAHPLAFLVAYGELAIGLSLTLGVLVRPASLFGFLYMLALLFSSNYPGPHAAFWQYFGASLDHSVLALCFLSFAAGQSDTDFSIRRWMPAARMGKPQDAGDGR
jgi:uncharacterized membrane protein YphA (DoxX/SURF4 family)